MVMVDREDSWKRLQTPIIQTTDTIKAILLRQPVVFVFVVIVVVSVAIVIISSLVEIGSVIVEIYLLLLLFLFCCLFVGILTLFPMAYPIPLFEYSVI